LFRIDSNLSKFILNWRFTFNRDSKWTFLKGIQNLKWAF
jgi:hypothetical protein